MAELTQDRTSRVKAAKEKLKGAKAALEAARKAARAAGGCPGVWVGWVRKLGVDSLFKEAWLLFGQQKSVSAAHLKQPLYPKS